MKNRGGKPPENLQYSLDGKAKAQSDEIDLVEVWILLWSRRKLYLFSALVFLVIGILGIELLFETRPMVSVRSVISTESLGIDGERIRLVSADGLVKRIEYVKLPQYVSIDKFHQISPYILATHVTSPRNSGLLELVTAVPESAEPEAVSFHNQLVDDILGELRGSPNSPSAEIRNQLFSMKSSMIRSQELLTSLNTGSAGVEPDSGGGLQPSNQFARDIRELQTEMKILTESVNYLEQTFSVIQPIVLVKAGVSEATPRFHKTMLYLLLILAAFFLALFVVLCNTFVSRVKERMASGG